VGRNKRQGPRPVEGAPTPRQRRGATRVAILVPNLFLFVPVEVAVRGAGAQPVPVQEPEAALEEECAVLVVDLAALGEKAPARLAPVCGKGIVVLAFGPHVEGESLAAVRASGAVALPRGAFLPRLPELLKVALATATPRG